MCLSPKIPRKESGSGRRRRPQGDGHVDAVAVELGLRVARREVQKRVAGVERDHAVRAPVQAGQRAVLDVELAPNSTPILVGKQPLDLGALAIPIPRRESACCACPK